MDNDLSSENRGEKRVLEGSSNTTSPVKKPKNDDKMVFYNHPILGNINILPIVALNPYINKCLIKARVTNKTDIRKWSNPRGDGKLFSMDLLDESGEIQCTGFKSQCDQFYDMIEVGKVYYISNCNIKHARKQYCNLNNDYEMTLTEDTEIKLCQDESGDVPTIKFNFEPLSAVSEKSDKATIDVLGVVKFVGKMQKILHKTTSVILEKRDIQIVDESHSVVSLTLWKSEAREFDGSNFPVVAVKGASIREFNGGKCLTLFGSSIIKINPDIPEAHKLRKWFTTIGSGEEMRYISSVLNMDTYMQYVTLQEAKDLKLGYSQSDCYFVKATIEMVETKKSLYKSCPVKNCMKKVIDQPNNMFRCEKCDKEFPNFQYRLMLNMSLADSTRNEWAIAFDEVAEKLIGLSADVLGQLQETDNTNYVESLKKIVLNTYIFKLRVRAERFNDEVQLKTTIMSVSPVNFVQYNRYLLNKLKKSLDISNV
ncbi:replication protein A 70 kDa DNA-binding subunit-like isoform X2 [Prorops nasuta]|uniref:replication protein A 70 kDa DNA-binding subunit-like isoform X2 n=1 Tax=Prorops nasuta TaxID=863751 RepID=UPI0034CE784C